MMAETESPEGNRRESEATAPTDASTDKRRRSSILTRARQSFVRYRVNRWSPLCFFQPRASDDSLSLWYRSGGNRGASVETLRGTHGADFEGNAIVKRGKGAGITCNCFGSSVSDGFLCLGDSYVDSNLLSIHRNTESRIRRSWR